VFAYRHRVFRRILQLVICFDVKYLILIRRIHLACLDKNTHVIIDVDVFS